MLKNEVLRDILTKQSVYPITNSIQNKVVVHTVLQLEWHYYNSSLVIRFQSQNERVLLVH